MRFLFLDDNLERHKVFKQNSIGASVDQVYTAQEAIDALNNEDVQYDMIFLDHDLNHETENQLNDEEEDGRTVASHLSTLDRYKNTHIVVHSLNSSGAANMFSILRNAGFSEVHVEPFAWCRMDKSQAGEWFIRPY